tara:strand:- start:668 stop:1156 length:489 start_codon:yes stop_codon:yes gene_type:complete
LFNSTTTILIIFSSILLSSPAIGDLAPDFTLPDESNIRHSLSNYRGKNVILYFYPKDNTPGCTKEACSFRDSYEEIIELNTIIFGVSYDKPSKHKNFKSNFSLPFTLLSDVEGVVTKAYNANGWFFPKRKTYLIDSTGIIVKIYEKVDISNHTKDIIEFLSN